MVGGNLGHSTLYFTNTFSSFKLEIVDDVPFSVPEPEIFTWIEAHHLFYVKTREIRV